MNDGNRLDAVFARDRPALICYLPLGDPRAPDDLAALYRQCGVDVFEIGVPGEPPSLDGLTISSSLERAARAGTTAAAASAVIRSYRDSLSDQAMVWMSYPARGAEGMVGEVAESGVDGVLFPASARRFERVGEALAARGIHLLHFLARDPPLGDAIAARRARGYVMLQAAPGVTGTTVLADNAEFIDALRQLGVRAPIALGFGIRTAEQARAAVAMGADGVIVGSAAVEAALRGRNELEHLLHALREALDA
jgi:tryptophan synthase alpha chain